MKKIFTLLSLMLFVAVLGINAQDRKTWDFSKGVSDESRADLDADGTLWTKTQTEGVTTSWASNAKINGEAMANGNVVKELAGLYFGEFAADNSLLYRISCIRLQKACSVTLKGLTAGQKIVINAQSANATATDRGFALSNAVDEGGNSSFICLGRSAEGAPEGGVTVVEATVLADGEVKISTGLGGTPAAGFEILSIVIGEGDKNIKKWDFSAWSDATKAQVCAAEDWTKKETDTKEYITGDEIRWNATEANLDANNDLTAGGDAIKEMKGLRHTNLGAYGMALAFDYGTTLDTNGWGPFKGGMYLWVTGANSTITVPNVKLGSTFKLGVESHNPSNARGFNLTVGDKTVNGQTTMAYADVEYAIPADAADEDGDGYVDVVIKATKGCHLYYIEAEVKDENVVDKNPKLNKAEISIKEGARLNPSTDGFILKFPKAQNITDGFNVSLALEGYYSTGGEIVDAFEVDGGNVAEGIAVESVLALEENTEYELAITKVIIGEPFAALSQEAAEGEALYTVKFSTTGAGITEMREWNFTLDVDQANSIASAITENVSPWAASSKGRYSYAEPISTPSPLLLDKAEGIKFPVTDGLLFTMATANDILIGTPAHTGVNGEANAGGNNGKLQLGGGTPSIIIPQCSAGDQITVKALWSTKNSGIITLTNATTAEGANEFNLSGSEAEYVITVVDNGDVELKSKNCVYTAIKVVPAEMLGGDITVKVVAKADDVELKTYQEATVVAKNTQIKGYKSYYLKDEEGNLYTSGSKGTEFSYSFTPLEDGDLVVEYKKKNLDGMVKAVYCSEAEDIEGATPCTEGNFAIRCSNGKAAMAETDITLCTLPAGTYKIKAMPYDSTKNGGVTNVVFGIGDETYTIISDGDNMSEPDPSAAFTLTAETPVIWKAGGDASHGLDAVIIYEYDETLSGINSAVVLSAGKVAKTIENGQIVILKGAKKYTVAGAQLK